MKEIIIHTYWRLDGGYWDMIWVWDYEGWCAENVVRSVVLVFRPQYGLKQVLHCSAISSRDM